MRHLSLALACAWLVISGRVPAAAELELLESRCPARLAQLENQAVTWHQGSAGDGAELDRWCRAVGPPILIARPAAALTTSPPLLDELVVVTWNAHLAEGRLAELVGGLRSGAFTSGRAVNHFVVLGPGNLPPGRRRSGLPRRGAHRLRHCSSRPLCA